MLALICYLPIAGFLFLALMGSRLPRTIAASVGCLTIAGSGAVLLSMLPHVPNQALHESVGLWIHSAGGVSPQFSFRLDALSATMAGIVCFVGLLIFFYSTAYMKDDEGHNRFFAYMNLFVGSMLVLLLADNMLLLFLGWEGVGLCSYLLIGFWYQDEYNVNCADKSFYLTRIGDVAFLIALLILYSQFGTWELSAVETVARFAWAPQSAWPIIVAALLLIAAVAKSAQLPLQVWLPDAMAGPIPVSALLHSSTMVTAGVYLIARFHSFFILAPSVMEWVAIIGGVTAFYAGVTAISQSDIKRVLAYSTISQIGYMFLALGVGAFEAAIFHFVTHAFFKSLLFLSAGAISHALNGERNIFKMGGLRTKMPVTFWCFTIGAMALAALPIVTSGFYSKDAILWGSYASDHTSLWIIGVAAAVLTGWYSMRLVVTIFLGKAYAGSVHKPHWVMKTPLIILASLALTAGFIETPHIFGGIELFKHWMHGVFATSGAAAHAVSSSGLSEGATELIASIASVSGIALGFIFSSRLRTWVQHWVLRGFGAFLHGLSVTGFYIDWTYKFIFVRSFQYLTRVLAPEWIDVIINGGLVLIRMSNQVVTGTQTGRVRWYVAGMALGAIILSAGALWL